MNGPSQELKNQIRNNDLKNAINSIFNISSTYEEISQEIVFPWNETFKYRNSRGSEEAFEKYIKGFLNRKNIRYSESEIRKTIMRYGDKHKEWDVPN